jgi:GNAT superfamily N-acetyltransferase
VSGIISAEDVNDVFRGEVYGEDDIFTAESFADFVARNDVDLRLSPRMRDAGGLIGLMVIGRRAARGWFGAYGVVPELREAGLGRKIFAESLECSRAAGLVSIEFEVLQRNVHAVRLYRSFGFETLDELLVWGRRPRSRAHGRLRYEKRREADIAKLARHPSTCWQREPRSVAAAKASALIECDGAYAYVRVRDERALILDAAARDIEAARALVRELDRRVPYDLTLNNEPAASPVSAALRESRWHVVEHQNRMMLLL